jgi:hypothetical protein
MLGQLNGTSTLNVARGSTHNAFFADPVTGKYYWAPSYSNGKQITEFATLTDFANNANGRVVNLAQGYEGTYHAALNGFFYYNIYQTSTMVKVRIADGGVDQMANLPNSGHTNQAAFNWGGYSDICFYVETGNQLYVLYAPNANSNTQVSQLDPANLGILKTWTIPRPKGQMGYAFLVNGVVYFGFTYSSPAINGTFTLANSAYNGAYGNSFTPTGGEYITHTYWNPAKNELYEQTNGRVLVYPNAAK